MIKEFKNTLLKQTTNKVIKELEGETGTLTYYSDAIEDDELEIMFTFSIKDKYIEVPVAFCIGTFHKTFFGEAYFEGTDGNQYLFEKEK